MSGAHAPDWGKHGLKDAMDWLLPFHHREQVEVEPEPPLPERPRSRLGEALQAIGHHLDAAADAADVQAAIERVDAALKLLAPFREEGQR